MNHLRLVEQGFIPNDSHSVKVMDELGELEHVARIVYPAARTAVSELFVALQARDVDGVIAASRRLSSAGELGRLSAQRLQGGKP